ncbi:hypothetical protein JHK86_031920 [Glycine max]|nr:hypothetical protein JHK86_031920 [Glycine max]
MPEGTPMMEAGGGADGGVFYLYGYGGTGKTFLWKTLSAALRSQGNIVLNVASSGIASLLLPGDKTSHSTFCLPLKSILHSTNTKSSGKMIVVCFIRCKKKQVFDDRSNGSQLVGLGLCDYWWRHDSGDRGRVVLLVAWWWSTRVRDLGLRELGFTHEIERLRETESCESTDDLLGRLLTQ